MAEQYTYQVARIHAIEASLLTITDLEQILGAKDEKEAINILSEKGFSGLGTYKDTPTLLKEEREKTKKLIKSLVPDSKDFDIFLLKEDFHNLKAAIKAFFSGEREGIFSEGGSLDIELIKNAVKENNFSNLPENMQKAGEEALSALAKTGDGQLADIIIDKALLNATFEAGKNSTCETVREYAELFVALSDIKIAFRGAKMNKSFEFLRRCLAKCESLDIEKLAECASRGEDALSEFIEYTPYSECLGIIKKSYTEFEKWCDNKIMSVILKQKTNPFTIAPIVAYYHARETEIGAVRLVLSGVLNGLDENLIKERLRLLYV